MAFGHGLHQPQPSLSLPLADHPGLQSATGTSQSTTAVMSNVTLSAPAPVRTGRSSAKVPVRRPASANFTILQKKSSKTCLGDGLLGAFEDDDDDSGASLNAAASVDGYSSSTSADTAPMSPDILAVRVTPVKQLYAKQSEANHGSTPACTHQTGALADTSTVVGGDYRCSANDSLFVSDDDLDDTLPLTRQSSAMSLSFQDYTAHTSITVPPVQPQVAYGKPPSPNEGRASPELQGLVSTFKTPKDLADHAQPSPMLADQLTVAVAAASQAPVNYYVNPLQGTSYAVEHVTRHDTEPQQQDAPAGITEDSILKLYESGVLTLPQAKATAYQFGFESVFAILDERERRSAAAFGMPTLSQMLASSQSASASTIAASGSTITASTSRSSLSNFTSGPFDFTAALRALENVPTSPKLSPAEQQRSQEIESKVGRFWDKIGVIQEQDPFLEDGRVVHVIVDMSNIAIGFADSYKVARRIPVGQRIRVPEFNFTNLSTIMERGRPAAARELATSVGSGIKDDLTKWPSHVLEANDLGYNTLVLDRVPQYSPRTPKRGRSSKYAGAPSDLSDIPVTSGDESTTEYIRPPRTGMREQGVDEALHLKMSDSVNDVEDSGEPATMVLATGDAAQAEFSKGFLHYATKALKKGLNVELITWKRTISSAWTDSSFVDKWGDNFRIIYLDDFLEDLDVNEFPRIGRADVRN